MPQLGDPNFQRSVVLMVEHSEAGSMGLVISRSAPLTLKELGKSQDIRVSQAKEAASVLIGGPVEPQRGFVLHDKADLDDKTEILPGLYMSVTVEALKLLLGSPDVRMRLCLGYSGWGPKQLEQEMNGGTWLFTEAATALVLESEPAQLWEETLKVMGVNPLTLVPGGGLN